MANLRLGNLSFQHTLLRSACKVNRHMRWPRGIEDNTEFPATSTPSGLVPGGFLGGSILQIAEPGPIPNTKMETSSPAKFMFWPEAGSVPETCLGLHPRTECFPLGMMASRKIRLALGWGGVGEVGGWTGP